MKKIYLLLVAILCTVAALATLPPITGTASLCSGGTTLLSNAITGGTWSCSSVFATVDEATGVVTGTAAGTAIVTYTAGAEFTTTTVTVNAALSPLLPTQTGQYCQGVSSSLNPGVVGGTWSSSNPAVGTVSTIGSSYFFNALSAGNTTVTYSLSPGCFVTRSLTVNALPANITGLTGVCQGSTITLSNSTPGGTWVTDAALYATVGTLSGVVTGVSPGAVGIRYRLSSGCEKSITVTVAPATATLTGKTTICPGTTSPLVFAAPGGAWESGTPSVASVSTTGVVTGLSAGTSVITLVHAGCPSLVTTTVTVTAIQPSITGTTSVCTNATTTLANAMAGGTWSSSNTLVANVVAGTGVVSGMAAGTAAISYTVPGCGSSSAVISVQPSPYFIGGVPYCASGTFTLTNAMTGGTWSSSNPASAIVDASSGVVTVFSTSGSASATISYSMPSGCFVTTGLNISPPPVVLPGCNNMGLGDTIHYQTSFGMWLSSNTGILQVNSIGDVRGVALGSATVTLVPSIDGCGVYVKTITVTPSTLMKQMTGNNILCPGGTTLLSDITAGGTWSSSDPGIAAVSGTGTVTAVSAGMATISYAISSSYHCTRAFYVNSNPSPITGPSSACAGLSVNITSGQGTYRFGPTNTFVNFPLSGGPILIDGPFPLPNVYSSSDTGIAKITANVTGTVMGVAAGVANITITTPSTSCSSIVPFTVHPTATSAISGPASVCIGGAATFTNATPGGSWSSSNPDKATIDPATGLVTAIATGVTTITYDVGGSCGSVVKQISVNPTPAPITGVMGTKCAGTSFTAVETVAGGTWSSSNPSVATVDASTGLVSCLATGTTILTYTLGPCGNIATALISVQSSYPITGAGNMCNGATTTLSSEAAGTWSSSNTTVATVATGIVTAVATGTAIITFTPVGCAATTRVVTVYPISPIVVSNTICINSADLANNATPGGVWSSSNTGRAVVNAEGFITPLAAGSVTITYTAPTGCYAAKTVTVIALPNTYNITGGGTYCTGSAGPVIGMTVMTAGVNYQLYQNGIAVGGPITVSSSPANFGPQSVPGIYSVMATTATGGCAAAMSGTATVATTATVPSISGPSTICIGGSAFFTNGISGGVWSSSATGIATVTSSGQVIAMSTGTATIQYSTPCGTATRIVTIGAAVPDIGGVMPFCQGTSIMLTNSLPGGTWSVSGPASINAVTGVLTGISGGSALASYTASNGCMKTATVAVNSIPVVMVSPAICVGQTLMATVVSGGPGGTWAIGNPSVISVIPTFGTGAGLGTSTISYTTAAGCAAVKVVSVTPACSGMPMGGTASASLSSVCPGGIVTLDLTGYTAACNITLQWQSSPDGVTWTNITGATNASYTVLPVSSANYRCAVNCTSGLTAYSTAVNVPVYNNITGHGFVHSTSLGCSFAHFMLNTCAYTTGYTVKTYYGDGTNDNTALLSVASLGTGTAHAYHSYALPGVYTIKQVLYNGAIAVDSVTYDYSHVYCNTLNVGIYHDINSNCTFDNSESLNIHPLTLAIDSNGVALDTINITGGLQLNTYGPPGTVYGFHVVSAPVGSVVSCPSAGVLYDTIGATMGEYPIKYFGLNCSMVTDFDLSETVSVGASQTQAVAVINISNSLCTPVSPTVTMHFSPKYHFSYAIPAPASVDGNTITWNLPTVSEEMSPRVVSVYMLPSFTLVPGDTIHSDYSVTPLTGDVNTINNFVVKVNTVMGSYDPNDIDVAPQGKILPCDLLTYTVRFENTGNDTARNIYVLDTLPSGVDAHSLNVVMASAGMNVSVTNDGVHNIAKFDFPGINLPDSSHHGLSSGIFSFSIKAKNALADGTQINNRVGIYFDDNSPVITNTISNTIGIENITGPSEVCVGATALLSNATPSGTWTSSAGVTAAGGTVSGITAGTATVSYTVSNSCVSRTATHLITVSSPGSANITGMLNLCLGGTSVLAHPDPGGTWSTGNAAVATVNASGIVTGNTFGTAVISYTSTGACGLGIATAIVTVDVVPPVAVLSLPSLVCEGGSYAIGASVSGGTWQTSDNSIATVSSAGIITGHAAGTATISYTTVYSCGSDIATIVATVSALPQAGTVSGPATVCEEAIASLSATVTGGAWISGDAAIASVNSTGNVTGMASGTTLISYTVTNSCGSAAATTLITVNELPDAGAIGGVASVCEGASVSLATSESSGIWTSSNNLIATISSTGELAGIAAGSATISFSVTNTCGTAVVTTIATVNPLPHAGAISGIAEVCNGATTPLNASIPGGLWVTGDITIASISATGVVTGVAEGMAVITYVMSNDCGVDIATDIVTVNPLPETGSISGISTVCAGNTSALTATIPGGLWTTSDPVKATISSAGLLTGIAAGTAIISYTVTNSCGNAVATVSAAVYPLPVAGTITGPAQVCVGTSATLTPANPGGVWATGNATVMTISSAGVITGVSAGTAIVSYTISNGCGMDVATSIATVNTTPDAGTVSGDVATCVGASSVLSSSVAGGVWASTAGPLTITPAGTITGIAAGMAIVSYTVNNGCGTAVTTVIATVNALPYAGIISGMAAVCEGASTTLSSFVPGGTWTSGNPAIAGVSSTGLATGVTTGTSIISYTVTNSCGADVATWMLTVDKAYLRTVDITATPALTVARGTTLKLSAEVSYPGLPAAYQWLLNGLAILGATDATYSSTSFVDNDSVACVVTSSDDCTYPCFNSVIIHTTTGFTDQSTLANIDIFPNPSAGFITVQGAVYNNDMPVAITITDMLGQIVYEAIPKINKHTINEQIQLSNTLANGMYMLQLKTASGSRNIHFVLER